MSKDKSKTRAVGRPATGQKIQAQCRLDPADVARLNARAARAGLAQAAFTRMIVLDYLNDPRPLTLRGTEPERVVLSDVPMPPRLRSVPTGKKQR